MKMMFLSRADIEKVLDMKSTIEGVREVYRLKSLGRTAVWPLISYDFDAPHGVMDIKSGCVFGENVHGLKMLNSFPGNARRGLPVFTGVLMIFDSETGIPQGVGRLLHHMHEDSTRIAQALHPRRGPSGDVTAAHAENRRRHIRTPPSSPA